MTRLLDDAPERRLFFDAFASSYEALRRDEAAWAEIEAERTAEAGAVRDGSA